MLKCNACGKFMAVAEGVTCPKCKCKSHRACVNIPEGVKVQSSWLCPECKARAPKTGNLNTPVRQAAYTADQSADSDCQCELPSDTQNSPIGRQQVSDLASEIRQFREEMRETRQDLKQYRQDMNEIRTLLKGYDERLSTLESKFKTLESRNNEVVPEEKSTTTIQAIISGLRQDLNDRDQEFLLTDIEVAGIPEEGEENLLHIVTACAAKLNITLEERDVVHCSRVGGVVRGDVNGITRPRPIAVRLARRQVRDSLLHAARVRRSLTTDGLGLRHPIARPFFINERLTKFNRQLFFKVRERSKQLRWRYSWTKEGKIYVRREAGTASFRIRVEADLDKVFGKVDVRSEEDIRQIID